MLMLQSYLLLYNIEDYVPLISRILFYLRKTGRVGANLSANDELTLQLIFCLILSLCKTFSINHLLLFFWTVSYSSLELAFCLILVLRITSLLILLNYFFYFVEINLFRYLSQILSYHRKTKFHCPLILPIYSPSSFTKWTYLFVLVVI